MEEVLCWCCEFFDGAERMDFFDNRLVNGFCKKKNTLWWSQNETCKDFIMCEGLRRNIKIPNF